LIISNQEVPGDATGYNDDNHLSLYRSPRLRIQSPKRACLESTVTENRSLLENCLEALNSTEDQRTPEGGSMSSVSLMVGYRLGFPIDRASPLAIECDLNDPRV
jgi:hypothetical protein